MRAHTFVAWTYANTAAAESLEIRFGPGLTFLTGSCGAHKTNSAHLARKTMGARPPVHAEQRADYDERVTASLAKGTVVVTVENAKGAGYTRTLTAGGVPVTRDEHGDEKPGVMLAGELFSCQFFGPLEIGTIARSRDGLLELFQRFEGAQIARLEDDIVEAERRLLESAGKVRELARKLDEAAGRTKELPQLEETLKSMQRVGEGEAAGLARAHDANALRGKQQRAMAALLKHVGQVRGAVGELANSAPAGMGRVVDASLEAGVHGDAFRRAHAAAQRAGEAVEELARRAHDTLLAAEREIHVEAAALAGEHAKENTEYAALVAQKGEGREDARERERVEKRHDELTILQKSEISTREAHEKAWRANRTIFEEREELLRRLRELHAGIKRRANAGLDELVGDRVRVYVRHGKDTRKWHAAVAEALKGSGTKGTLIKAIFKGVAPSELAAAVRADDPEPIMRVDPMVSGKRKRALAILEFLRENRDVDALEIVRIPDVVRLKLKTPKGYEVSPKLSSGQANICVLVLLLLQARGPIVIDEPEASLDDDYINDVLVPALLIVKKRCQIILVSHHPSLIVLTEPEMILKLSADAGEVRIVRKGTLDEMRDVVEKIDGGRDAFLLRARLYGHKVGGA